MSLEGFDTCPKCSGYMIYGTYRSGRTLSSMCRCEEEALTAKVERDLKATIELHKPRREAA